MKRVIVLITTKPTLATCNFVFDVMHRMPRTAIVAALVLAAVALAWRASADSPPAAADSEPIYSANHRYALVIDPVQKLARVFRGVPRDRPEWQMPATFSTASLSDNGRFLVASYRGGNLLDLAHAPDEVMLSFYDRGRLLSQVRLHELLREDDLVRTMSHYVWAVSFEFVSATLLTSDKDFATMQKAGIPLQLAFR